jgi:hypothetical protein
MKPINGYDNYFIKEDGTVWSTKRSKKPKQKATRKNSNGYEYVTLNDEDGFPYSHSVHRLVAEHFCEGWFEGAIIKHIDGDNGNNHCSNLRWGKRGKE